VSACNILGENIIFAVTNKPHLLLVILDHLQTKCSKNVKCNVINQKNADGHCPIHVCSYYDYVESLVLLLKYGADPNIIDEDRDSIGFSGTFMDIARKKKSTKVLKAFNNTSAL